MNGYRREWLLVWRSVAVTGACLAVFVYPVASTIALLCTGATVGAVITFAAYPAVAGIASPTRGKLHRAAVNALSVGVALLAVAGFTVVLHAWLWPLILLAAATSPWAINRLRRHAKYRLPAPSPDSETAGLPVIPVEVDVFVPTVRGLAERDLCRAWRGSYQWLESTRSPALSAYIVALRQAYLDELDRRDPVGLHAWLDSCPRPRGGPEKYLHHGTDGHHLAA